MPEYGLELNKGEFPSIGDHFKQWWIQSQQAPSPVRISGLSRKRLMEMFGLYGLTNGAEIGVDRGTFSEYMFKVIPGLHLYCVDPWHWRLRGESRFNSTVKRLEDKSVTILREKSETACYQIPDESLDFVYIDGDHTFDYVMLDLIQWSKKVKVGGVVAGHDYYRFRRAGVVPAVDAYTQAHMIHEWFITDYRLDRTPSFFWVRERSFVDELEEQD